MKNTNKFVLVDNDNLKDQGGYETMDALKEDLEVPENDNVVVMTRKNFDKFNKKSYDNGKEDGIFKGYVLSTAGACLLTCVHIIVNSIKNKKK